ncbi:MAG: flagellar biosynthesis protein FlhB [Allosphingosinicella sp.]|uniref:EscU/YscU/HrcU family type III secretion system export apparatus switch protein n=1 Tax=Allosphingosinicella sp. TaxID=2823234 RepID=UPI00394A36E4
MSDAPDNDQKTEAPTDKRRRDAAEKGDVLQSKELGVALVVLGGAIWIALAGPMMVGALRQMLIEGLTFDAADVRNFDPATAALRLIGVVVLPLFSLFALTLVAAIGTPAALGSLGFRSKAFGFKANKMNPLSGLKRIFGVQGLVELGKSIAKVALLGAVGAWLLLGEARALIGLAARDIGPALDQAGNTFIVAVLAMALALAVIALIDVPAQMFQRTKRLRMTRQEVKDEHKQTEGSPELKAAVRRRQHEVLRGSARAAVAEATVVLTNPTHFAVALRYRPGEDAAPVVVARGRGATADAIRALAGESGVPILSYPQLARAIYFTARTGQFVREDLYMAVAAVLAFVFNLDAALASGAAQPRVDVPPEARFDASGRPEN